MGREPLAPASPATMAEDLAAALDPFKRVEVWVIRRYARAAGQGLEQPFPWCDIWCIGGTPEDKTAVLVAMRGRPDLATPPPWWPPRGLDAVRAQAAEPPPRAAPPAPAPAPAPAARSAAVHEELARYRARDGRADTPTSQITD